MALFLTEDDVEKLLSMPLAIEAVTQSFLDLASGKATLHPRQRLHVPGMSYLHYMAGADAASGYMGLKIYTSSKEGLRFLVPLFHIDTGDLAALIEANYLGQMRTGAASAVATRAMARDDARRVGIIGTGLQARTQLEAVASVRKIERIEVYGRDQGRREQFARDMSRKLNIPVNAANTAEEAVRGADIVITSTTSSKPVMEGKWILPGAHINAISANFLEKRELDDEAVRRADIVVADSREQSRLESGDLVKVFAEDPSRWENVHDLADVVAGKVKGRTNAQQITLFKSNGIATEDVVVAGRILELAKEKGLGREVQLWKKSFPVAEARDA